MKIMLISICALAATSLLAGLNSYDKVYAPEESQYYMSTIGSAGSSSNGDLEAGVVAENEIESHGAVNKVIVNCNEIVWNGVDEDDEAEEDAFEEAELVKIEDKDITFSVEFFGDNKEIMPYFLYTPSTRETSSEPIPMIIWLHGGDDYYCKFENMSKRGLPAALENWGDLDGFDAYVLCPQWTGNWKIAGWHNPKLRAALDNVIADVLAKNPINTERIIISGHSMGGRGAICNALQNANDFDYYKVATVGGFLEETDLQYLKDLDIRFYTGKVETGEYEGIYSYNTKNMVKYFGEENLFIVNGSHGTAPIGAFLLDGDGNNKSDLIEWMLADKKTELVKPMEEVSDELYSS